MQKPILVIVILLVFGGFGIYLRGHSISPDRPAEFSLLPMETDKYIGNEQRFDAVTYAVLKADTTTLRMYHDRDTHDIYWLFIAYFSSQKYGSQIHSPLHCVPGGGYRIDYIEPYPIELYDGFKINVRRLMITSPVRKEIMFYWYETRSGALNDEYDLKLDLMKNSIFQTPTDAAICRVTMTLRNGESFEAATEKVVGFIRDFYEPIKTALPFN